MKIEIPNNNLVISFFSHFLSFCVYISTLLDVGLSGVLSDDSPLGLRK